ncbi:hypothetical protein BFR57_09510 [Idiomarina sp. MD25a]|uniref:hypothetical protein n=1 Tax=Idiomarina sp. MD25a TaxID=1889913 RepID=UPI0008F81C20|nr:hypothetical protein [Idiomarina sp. MD25a]OIM97953.1 hypothetical protein BFR57_09510 [Idiomarina sp. MD25a]
MINKKHPEVLRVVEYVLDKASKNEEFSVQTATKSKELNGLNRHKLARIMRDICLDPEDDGSLARYTTVDNNHTDNISCHWQLNANAYFSYLSYKSVQTAKRALWISSAALAFTIMGLIFSGMDVFS